MTNSVKGRILKATALVIDTVVPLIVTVSNFPIWIDKSADATVSGVCISGVFLVIALFCLIPALRQFVMTMKTPSVPVLWGVLLVIFLCIRSIIDQMVVVLFVGTIANIVGAILYNIGKSYDNK